MSRQDDSQIDLEGLRLGDRRSPAKTERHVRLPRPRQGERFLRGPIPLSWLSVAAKLPGSALNVAIAIWYVAGMKKGAAIRLSVSSLGEFGVEYHSAYRGLAKLEQAGLVEVIRHRGRKPIVTVLGRR